MQTYQNPINTCDFYNLDSHNRVGGVGDINFAHLS